MTPAISDLAKRLNVAMNRQPHSMDGVTCARLVELEVISLHLEIDDLRRQLEAARASAARAETARRGAESPPWHVDAIATDAEAHTYPNLSRGGRRVALCGYEPDPTAPLYRVSLPPRMFLCEACQAKVRIP